MIYFIFLSLFLQLDLKFKNEDLKIFDQRFNFLQFNRDFSFTGVNLLKMPDGNFAVISVASIILVKPNKADELKAYNYCSSKALAEFSGFSNGVHISSVTIINEKTTVEIGKVKQNINSISDHTEISKQEIKGLIQGMTKIAEWRSSEQNDTFILFVAMGKICDKKGKTIFAK